MLTDTSKWVEDILAEIVKSKLLDSDSRFYEVSKERLLRVCSHFYPLTEFVDDSETRDDFLFYTCILFSYTYYLDESIDSLDNDSNSVCSNQIASFLLMRYTKWLLQYYDISTLKSFYSYFDEYSRYLIAEKKWEYPDEYCQECFLPVTLGRLPQKGRDSRQGRTGAEAGVSVGGSERPPY